MDVGEYGMGMFFVLRCLELVYRWHYGFYKKINILLNNLSTSATDMGLETFIFQQDNDPKHTSRLTKRYSEEKNIKLLPWTPQSQDLNSIEPLWAF